MFFDYSQGSFLWNWFHSYAGLHGMALSMITAMLVIFFTKWSPFRSCVKVAVAAGMIASAPLGFSKMGIDIPINSDQVATYLSLFGTVLTIAIGVPYLFHQTLRAGSGGHSKYVGYTVQEQGHATAQSGKNTFVKSEPTGNQSEGRLQTVGLDVKQASVNDFTSAPSFGSPTQDVRSTANTMTIGRASDNDIVVNDPAVSRHHARVTFNGTRYEVEDLGSKSGTRLDGRTLGLNESSVGNTMKIGDTEIRLDGTGKYRDQFNHAQAVPNVPLAQAAEAVPGDDVQRTRVIKGAVSQLAWLAATSGPGAGSSYQLKEGVNAIGRHAEAGFSVNDPHMSRMHAVVRVDKTGLRLYDLGSSGGTRVNGTELASRTLGPDSVIRVGQTNLRLVETDAPYGMVEPASDGQTILDTSRQHVGALIATSGKDTGQSFMLSDGDNMIGRGSGCKVNLRDDTVSRHHAIIRCRNGKLSLFDIGSESGTQLDGEQVGHQDLKNGDVISTGRSEFTVMAPRIQAASI